MRYSQDYNNFAMAKGLEWEAVHFVLGPDVISRYITLMSMPKPIPVPKLSLYEQIEIKIESLRNAGPKRVLSEQFPVLAVVGMLTVSVAGHVWPLGLLSAVAVYLQRTHIFHLLKRTIPWLMGLSIASALVNALVLAELSHLPADLAKAHSDIVGALLSTYLSVALATLFATFITFAAAQCYGIVALFLYIFKWYSPYFVRLRKVWSKIWRTDPSKVDTKPLRNSMLQRYFAYTLLSIIGVVTCSLLPLVHDTQISTRIMEFVLQVIPHA